MTPNRIFAAFFCLALGAWLGWTFTAALGASGGGDGAGGFAAGLWGVEEMNDMDLIAEVEPAALAHRRKINREAVADLVAAGLAEDQGIAVVTALAKGAVRHCSISY